MNWKIISQTRNPNLRLCQCQGDAVMKTSMSYGALRQSRNNPMCSLEPDPNWVVTSKAVNAVNLRQNCSKHSQCCSKTQLLVSLWWCKTYSTARFNRIWKPSTSCAHRTPTRYDCATWHSTQQDWRCTWQLTSSSWLTWTFHLAKNSR